MSSRDPLESDTKIHGINGMESMVSDEEGAGQLSGNAREAMRLSNGMLSSLERNARNPNSRRFGAPSVRSAVNCRPVFSIRPAGSIPISGPRGRKRLEQRRSDAQGGRREAAAPQSAFRHWNPFAKIRSLPVGGRSVPWKMPSGV